MSLSNGAVVSATILCTTMFLAPMWFRINIDRRDLANGKDMIATGSWGCGTEVLLRAEGWNELKFLHYIWISEDHRFPPLTPENRADPWLPLWLPVAYFMQYLSKFYGVIGYFTYPIPWTIGWTLYLTYPLTSAIVRFVWDTVEAILPILWRIVDAVVIQPVLAIGAWLWGLVFGRR